MNKIPEHLKDYIRVVEVNKDLLSNLLATNTNDSIDLALILNKNQDIDFSYYQCIQPTKPSHQSEYINQHIGVVKDLKFLREIEGMEYEYDDGDDEYEVKRKIKNPEYNQYLKDMEEYDKNMQIYYDAKVWVNNNGPFLDGNKDEMFIYETVERINNKK